MCFAKGRSGTPVTLRRSIPRRLALVEAPRPIGAVVVTVSAAYDGQYRTTGIAWVEREGRCPAGSAVRACRTGGATCQTCWASGEAALHARCRDRMMEGPPVEDISDRFLDAISRLEAVADAVSPNDAHRQLDETSMQVFWRTWPGLSSWAGSLWRLLNEELMDPANSSPDLDADEVGGSG